MIRRTIPNVLRLTVSRPIWARSPSLLAADRIEDPDRRAWCEEGADKDGSSLVKRSASEIVTGGSWSDMSQRGWIAIASWADSRRGLGGWNERVWDMEGWPWRWKADVCIGCGRWFKSAVQGQYRSSLRDHKANIDTDCEATEAPGSSDWLQNRFNRGTAIVAQESPLCPPLSGYKYDRTLISSKWSFCQVIVCNCFWFQQSQRLRLFYGAKSRSWPTLSPLNRGWKIHGHVKAATYFLIASKAPPDLLIGS